MSGGRAFATAFRFQFFLWQRGVATRTGQTLRASAPGYFFRRLFGLWFVGLRLAPIELACW
jgi:hypothetical protein